MQARASSFNQTAAKLPNQQCLLRGIPQHAQLTLRDVTNSVVLPLDTVLSLLSFTFNSVILLAILRRRSIQRPSLLLLCSLSTTDEIWAIMSVVDNAKFLILKDLCLKEAGAKEFFAANLCYLSTIGSLALISYDRFLAVRNPLWYRSRVTRSRAIKQIAMVWVIGVIVAGIGSSYNHFPSVSSILLYLGSSLSLCYALTIIGCYMGVLIANCRHKACMHLYGGAMETALKREKRLANTVGLILLVFCLTLLPAMVAISHTHY